MQSSSRPHPFGRTGMLALLGALAAGGSGAVAACANSSGPTSGFGAGAGSSSGSGSLSGNGSSGAGSLTGSGSLSGSSSSGTLQPSTCSANCTDFQAMPIVADSNVPSNASSIFGTPGSGNASGGPCLYEPTVSAGSTPGALFPNNWLRPIFEFTPPSGQNLFEITLSAKVEANPLVVYTTKTSWTLPKDVWTAMTGNIVGQPITVTVRGVSASGGTPSIGTSGTFSIAPAAAGGAMIYWSTTNLDQTTATTNLQGFQVGDEGTNTALTPWQVKQTVWASPGDGGPFPSPAAPEPVGCIGCHTSTPDGENVGFTAQWPWPNAIASVQAADAGGVPGSAPSWLAAGAIANLSPNTDDVNWAGPQNNGSWNPVYNNGNNGGNDVNSVMLGMETFSKVHYATGDRIEVTTVGASENRQAVGDPFQATGNTTELIWIDLEFAGAADTGRPSAFAGAPNNGGWGIIARGTDTNSAGSPSWSHDGNSIAYTSVNGGTADGRLTTPISGSADIMVVPYNDKAGGQPSAVQGASDPSWNEYYPAFSPDDALIAFNRVDKSVEMYQQPTAEVFVVPTKGASAATRLVANDPPACQGLKSPGVENTWPKWAPDATAASDGNTYYWVTFSSTRSPDATTAGVGRPQLYVAAVTESSSGVITTYPAIYLWNQDPTQNNLIPAWDNFTIAHGTEPPPR
jgi:hypothetical protein